MHALPPAAVPPATRCRACESFPWWHFDELLAEVGDSLDDAAQAGIDGRRSSTTAGGRHWTARVVCHGDVHPDNVVMTADGPVLLDWDLLCLGPPGWDHAMLLRLPRWGWPARWYDEFAAGYGRSFADDPTADALAELRLVAATLMRLRAGRGRPGGDARGRSAAWRTGAATPTPRRGRPSEPVEYVLQPSAWCRTGPHHVLGWQHDSTRMDAYVAA